MKSNRTEFTYSQHLAIVFIAIKLIKALLFDSWASYVLFGGTEVNAEEKEQFMYAELPVVVRTVFDRGVFDDGGFIADRLHTNKAINDNFNAKIVCPMSAGRVGKLYFRVNI